jgi:hypothetical protein
MPKMNVYLVAGEFRTANFLDVPNTGLKMNPIFKAHIRLSGHRQIIRPTVQASRNPAA